MVAFHDKIRSERNETSHDPCTFAFSFSFSFVKGHCEQKIFIREVLFTNFRLEKLQRFQKAT